MSRLCASLLIVVSMLLFAACSRVRTHLTPCTPLCAEAGEFVAFEELKALPSDPFFIVSPNEEWLAFLEDGQWAQQIRVAHLPTGKSWTSDPDLSPPGLGGPVAFSDDGKELYSAFGLLELSPEMEALEFHNMAGRAPHDLFMRPRLPPPYHPLHPGGSSRSKLIRRDRVRSVSYDAIVVKERAAGVLPKVILGESFVLQEELSVSPDGKYVAGIVIISPRRARLAEITKSNRSKHYGVLIRLEERRLVARPFAMNVYGSIRWSSDSRAIYFYALPGAHRGAGRLGTIYRLRLRSA